MDYKKQALDQMSRHGGSISNKSALIGLDGFVDKIVHPIDKRHGPGEDYTPIATITAFGERVLAAAGNSTNIEIQPVIEKLGGNGPIMANALMRVGADVRYVGALGSPQIHPVFADMARRSRAVSLCDPGITHALEFDDGKIMLGTMQSLAEITYERILETMGEGAFLDALSRVDLLALTNWTMIPNMTSVMNDILNKALPTIGPRESGRAFFFDLADPEKRSDGDIRNVLTAIARFRSHGAVTLGLNFKEALLVNRVMGNNEPDTDAESLKRLASELRSQLDLTTIVIHPTDCAVCATRHDAWWVRGPYTEKPKITTGAGDHFNAGFACGQMLGLEPPACLTLAVSFSGYYVRTARSPGLSEAESFLRNWN